MSAPPVKETLYASQWETERQRSHRNRRTSERLNGYVQALTNRRQRLGNVAAIYHQPCVYPLQVSATLAHLLDIRRVAGCVSAYLGGLEPAETERIKPYGSIAKLRALDFLLTEILLNMAMFAEVCQIVSPERVQVHMTIRAGFPALLACYDDLVAQLTALSDKAHQQEERSEGVRI